MDFTLSLQRVEPSSVRATTGCEVEDSAGMAVPATATGGSFDRSSKNSRAQAEVIDHDFS